MKKLLFYLILFFGFQSVSAQDTTLKYLNDDWKKTKESKATFIKKSYETENGWFARFYHLSGELRMEGQYKGKKTKKGNGMFTYFYKNGQKEKEVQYAKGKKNGIYNGWAETGEKITLGQHDGVRKTGTWVSWYENGNLDSEGEYKASKMSGAWRFYYDNGQVSAEETFSDNKFISGKYWNEDGTRFLNGEPSVKPQFVGGVAKLAEFIRSTMVYPEEAIEDEIRGKVMVKFQVTRKGEVKNATISSSIHPLLDNEALRIIGQSPNWIPGREHNRPQTVWHTIPVKFEL